MMWSIQDSEIQPDPSMEKLRQSLSHFDEPAVLRSLDQVDKHGIFSEFVRRCRIEYLRSSFEQTCRLFEVYRAYVEGTAEEQEIESISVPVPAKRPLSAASEQAPESKKMRPESPVKEPRWVSWHRLEHVFNTQVEMIEKTGDSDVSPALLDNYLNLIQKQAPELAKVHQLRFINYIRTNEYEGALSSLHRFFDYCLSDQDVYVTISSLFRLTYQPYQMLRSPMYQYVLLHLGILETKFGHVQQARLALDEALEVAREANDQNCINEVLRYIKGFGSSIQDPPYIASDDTTEESNVTYLQSLHKIAQAQDMIRCGASPKSVLEAISRSAVQTTAHNVSALTQTQHLMKALIFQYYGVGDLSNVYMDMALATEDGSIDVVEKSCIFAAEKFMASGKYQMALAALEAFKKKHTYLCELSIPWKQTLARLQRKMGRARDTSMQLQVKEQENILALTNPEGVEQAFYALHQQAIELYEQDDPAECLRILEESRTRLETAGYVSALADNSVSQAHVYLEDGDPESAIKMLQHALNLSCKTSDASHYFASILKMAEAYLQLSTPENTAKAIQILEENFPKILGMGAGSLQPALYFVYARALKANGNLKEALHYIEKAIEGYRILGDVGQQQKANTVKIAIHHGIYCARC
ncbi:Anaphase-promoting complex subunit 5 [Apophysomyces ossiformis]|uniref:Anaphase-promoting complex subunit 5 n=1 Tax=Apophysomyces ossiformis TaxID=679940 RepID=A0A8H7BWF9_9FUNG|nr:Anaphase-promoting complex subunit 5 [Apophysomyces ossiformis]